MVKCSVALWRIFIKKELTKGGIGGILGKSLLREGGETEEEGGKHGSAGEAGEKSFKKKKKSA